MRWEARDSLGEAGRSIAHWNNGNSRKPLAFTPRGVLTFVDIENDPCAPLAPLAGSFYAVAELRGGRKLVSQPTRKPRCIAGAFGAPLRQPCVKVRTVV